MGSDTKRIRSPNYPAIGLPEAIDSISKVWHKNHQFAADRDTVLKALGYKSYNGASAPILSALLKFGLLERSGDDLRVSELARRLINPLTPADKLLALKEAARGPSLFGELIEHFGGAVPANDELIRTTLIRREFAPNATAQVIRAFRETIELVEREENHYNSLHNHAAGEEPMDAQGVDVGKGGAGKALPPPPNSWAASDVGGERELSRGDLSRDGTRYRLLVAGDVGAKELRKLIKLLTVQMELLSDDEEPATTQRPN